jgi:uncharacterized protein YcbK (DUF882 family)
VGDLTKNFSRKEFSCSCGCDCVPVSIQMALVTKLQRARNEFGPITITSGVRCPEYNKKIGGHQNSSHLNGWAADLHCFHSYYRFQLIEALKMAGFSRFGIAKLFVHVDCDPNKTPGVIWLYQ